MGGKRGGARLLCLGQLLVERLRGVKFKGHGGFANRDRGRLLIHLLALQVALKRIEEEPVVRHAVPVEHLLLLLRPDAVVLVEEVQEPTFGLLQSRISAGLEIAQIGEDALLEFLGVLDRAAKGLETKGEASDNVGAGYMEEVTPASGVNIGGSNAHRIAGTLHLPEHTRDVVAGREQETTNELVGLPVDRSREKEVFH